MTAYWHPPLMVVVAALTVFHAVKLAKISGAGFQVMAHIIHQGSLPHPAEAGCKGIHT